MPSKNAMTSNVHYDESNGINGVSYRPMFCNLCLSCVVSFGVIILKIILKQYAPKQLSKCLFVSVIACCVTQLS